MKDNLKKLEKEFINNTDLCIRKININMIHKVYVIFLESLCSQDKINDYILKKLTTLSKLKDVISVIPGSNITTLKKYDEIEYYLYSGYTVILNQNIIYAVETKANIDRSVSTNEIEPSILGPKNAFIENYQVNLGLIKRRIKSHNLQTINMNIGRISNCKIGILYIDGIVKNNLVNKVIERLNNIDIDLINDTNNLKKYLSDSKLFPTIITTERPDKCARNLSNGKIVIIAENSSTALIIPGFFINFINPSSDEYTKNYNISFTKIIRISCYFLSMIIPAFYIAITNYNQETIPTSLLINFAIQRDGVPFPAIVECIFMLLLCEILRESDLRFPVKYGSAISILGALIIGDAAVKAGLVSPIMIIVISFTYTSSLIFPDPEMVNSLRYYRFFLLILSAFLGLYGLLMGIVFFFINLCSINSFDMPYTYPISPFNKSYFFQTIVKGKSKKRAPFLSNNETKEV